MFARSEHVMRNITLHLAVAFLSISVHFLLLIHRSYSGGHFFGTKRSQFNFVRSISWALWIIRVTETNINRHMFIGACQPHIRSEILSRRASQKWKMILKTLVLITGRFKIFYNSVEHTRKEILHINYWVWIDIGYVSINNKNKHSFMSWYWKGRFCRVISHLSRDY